MPAILARVAAVRVVHAHDQMPLERGLVIVAPPDHHLVVRGDVVGLDRGPRVRGHPPSGRQALRDAAASLGSRVVGVVLPARSTTVPQA